MSEKQAIMNDLAHSPIMVDGFDAIISSMLRCVNLYKDFDQQPLLRGVDFSVDMDEIVCLLGPSGSGKSTILRIIAGLETPEKGQVLWNDTDLAGVAVHQRQFGLMFQDYALFPHRTVSENVAFGLRMQHLAKDEISVRVAEALEMVRMMDFADRSITDLSGGEQQRVALARSLAPRPRLLMLDEPLGALDHQLRVRLQSEVRQILCQAHIPAIYVTHDHEEAFSVADRLILLKDGLIEQQGPPLEVFSKPRSAWVAAFFGMGNFFNARVRLLAPLTLDVENAGVWQVDSPDGDWTVGQSVVVLARPEKAQLGEGSNSLVVEVAESRFKGKNFENVGQTAAGVPVEFHSLNRFKTGETVTVHFSPADLLVLKE